ncbi:hypothetical protein I4F81_010338 [Pyropia yezoensis]|uniref:Uncharacterized protein n=1 Tax=Pyropia yezoensis TaxID=2788 RepID=A0ACC3CC79_PYRYE|nr:hypothetical protein I4F81_010338 [Neopyropia yezoensis]
MPLSAAAFGSPAFFPSLPILMRRACSVSTLACRHFRPAVVAAAASPSPANGGPSPPPSGQSSPYGGFGATGGVDGTFRTALPLMSQEDLLAAGRKRLAELATSPMRPAPNDSARDVVEALVTSLQRQGQRPLTDMFADLALAGEWALIYSPTAHGGSPPPAADGSGPPPPDADGSVKMEDGGLLSFGRIGQTVVPDKRLFVNYTEWTLTALDGAVYTGVMFIVCGYRYGPSGWEVQLLEHQLRPGRDEVPGSTTPSFPADVEGLVRVLTRALPREFFDPDGAQVGLAYVDPTMRLDLYGDTRYGGVRNVYVRRTLGEDSDGWRTGEMVGEIVERRDVYVYRPEAEQTEESSE